MAFVQRLLSFQFALSQGNFDGGNSATIDGLRASVKIHVPGHPDMASLVGEIFGLPLSIMNQLTTLGTQLTIPQKNTLTVLAGDSVSGMSTVFAGTITVAFANAQSQPDVSLHVECLSGLYEAVKMVPPTSVSGGADVAQTMQTLAGQAGLTFENNGVTAQIANPYLSGSVRDQIVRLARHANICSVIDSGTLAIWPPGQTRSASATISPDNGLVGYPAFTSAGIIVRKLYDPTVVMGGKITVQSSLTPACGDWGVTNVDHELESMVPHGKWFSTIEATKIGGI